MKAIRLTIIALATAQLYVWILVLQSTYWPEHVQQGVMILAAVLTFAAAVRARTRWVTLAQIGQVAALLAYVGTTALWIGGDQEVLDGFLMLALSGAIALVIVPPVGCLVALHLLRRILNKAVGSAAQPPVS